MNETNTLASAYKYLTRELTVSEIENPQLEARILLAFAARVEQTRVIGYPEDKLDNTVIRNLEKIIARRKTGEPIAYITGVKEFWSLNFNVTPETLIPRPDSETIVQSVLDTITNHMDRLSILDLGTGSGCLLLALLSELPNAKGVGIDISPATCKIAKKNAKELGLNNRAKFCQGNWMEGILDQFDIIVTNPPYIAEPDIKLLDREIQLFEPHLALSGGPDGVSAYRLIAKGSIARLKTAGILVVEIGINQAQSIKNIFIENGLEIIKTQRDFSNIERCILATVGHS
jgi:release factor glutamine methyltransferase